VASATARVARELFEADPSVERILRKLLFDQASIAVKEAPCTFSSLACGPSMPNGEHGALQTKAEGGEGKGGEVKDS